MLRPIAPPSTTTLLPSPPPIQFNLKPHKPFKLNHPNKPFSKTPFLTPSNLILTKPHITTTTFQFSNSDREFHDEEIEIEQEDNDEGTPWEGAIIYKRNAAISHLEYCTTLERLGLKRLSSDVSRIRASEMGLRVVKSVKDYPNGTPVLISVDVVRRKGKLRLDGIVRTVLSLNCNRCGEPAAQSIFSDFSLLLCEEPIQEPDTINLGVIFGEEKSRAFEAEDNEYDDSFIDLDDHLYFPVDQKVIDISKNIRDLIHIEITIDAICGPNCKGLCLKCGTNLNISKCTCRASNVEEKGYGPLADLRKQMQQK